MSLPFKQIPISLLQHPKMLKAPPEQYRVMMILLSRMCYAPCEHDDHGVDLHLLPGQLAFTYDQLAAWANVDRNHAVRCVKRLFENRIVTYEVIHVKTVLTFTYPELCNLLRNQSEMRSDTGMKQERNENEMQKDKTYTAYTPYTSFSTTPPTSSPKEKVVVVFYDCLSDFEIPEHKKIELSQFPELRVKQAVEFVRHESFTPNKSILDTLFWHVRAEYPPVHSEKPVLPEIKLAFEHNEIYSRYHSKVYKDNLACIKEGFMYIWELGGFQRASLKHPVAILKRDFVEYSRQYEIEIQGIESQKHQKIEEFA